MMTKSARIAVAVDFSPESELAARQALELARASGAELVLVHAYEWLPELPFPARAVENRVVDVDRAIARECDRLAEWREDVVGHGPAVSQTVIEGYSDVAVTEAARELGAHLLVVGTHGRTGLRWFALGSVAESIIRRSSTDVLVARGADRARGGFHKILVATDFSLLADRALERALDLAAPDASIEVVHFHTPHHVRDDRAAHDQVVMEELRAAGERLTAGKVAKSGAPVRFSIAAGRPIPGIVHRLEAEGHDLVALGSQGRRGFEHLALGSIAQAVARRAPCSVLVAKSSSERRR